MYIMNISVARAPRTYADTPAAGALPQAGAEPGGEASGCAKRKLDDADAAV